jgi:hypothetical protein
MCAMGQRTLRLLRGRSGPERRRQPLAEILGCPPRPCSRCRSLPFKHMASVGFRTHLRLPCFQHLIWSRPARFSQDAVYHVDLSPAPRCRRRALSATPRSSNAIGSFLGELRIENSRNLVARNPKIGQLTIRHGFEFTEHPPPLFHQVRSGLHMSSRAD